MKTKRSFLLKVLPYAMLLLALERLANGVMNKNGLSLAVGGLLLFAWFTRDKQFR